MIQRIFVLFVSLMIFLQIVQKGLLHGEESSSRIKNHSFSPQIILWAWERAENLEFIDTHKIGVAFLSRTIEIKGEQVHILPRLQPLKVPEGTYLIAVAHLSTSREGRPQFSPALLSRAVTAISEMANIRGISGIQIDFDARVSERVFYNQLIRELRRDIPNSIALSITALASWCIHDCWISELPIDDAIPMLFRMGAEKDWVFQFIGEGRAFKPICSESVGISTDENHPEIPRGRRIFIFNPNPWTEKVLIKIMEGIKP